MRILISLIMALIVVSPVWSADEWLKTRPALTGDQWTAWPAASQANNAALDRVLANYRQGMSLSYSSATTIAVSAGEVVCSTASGDVRKMRQNTSATNVTFSDIDTGSEAPSTTYYLYANCDADATTATFKVSASSTAPTGVTHFKRLGSFYNDASSNIQTVSNDNDYKTLVSASSKSVNVVYQATTDGIVVAGYSGSSTYTATQMFGKSDASNPPTAVLGSAEATWWPDSEINKYTSMSFPVKRGDFYTVTSAAIGGYSSSATSFAYFISLGN